MSIAISFVTLPQAFATWFSVSRNIAAPVNQVWNSISNVDMNKTDNNVEREVMISPSNQKNTNHQFVTLYPEQMKIQTNVTEGSITGSRIIALEPIYEDRSRIHVIWNIDLSGIPIAVRGVAENDIKQTTVEDLIRIAKAVE